MALGRPPFKERKHDAEIKKMISNMKQNVRRMFIDQQGRIKVISPGFFWGEK